MKILVLSDSHGELRYMEQAILDEAPDHIFHLGDGARDVEKLREKFPQIPLAAVAGNCDLCSMNPKVLIRELGGVRFFVTHGHEYGVKTSVMRLCYAAQEAGARVALFGHTHNAIHRQEFNVHLLNPGTAGGGSPSYGVVEIENGWPTCRIVRF